MKITVIGTGYVGLVTGTCLAEAGNDVLCVDIDKAKVAKMQNGEVPIYEPHLETYFERNIKAGRLRFSTKTVEGVDHGDVIFLALPTPEDEDGSADLSYVLGVTNQIGGLMKDYKIIVGKSTVPVGTGEKVKAALKSKTNVPFDVVSNPEFLREGFAVEDFMKPDRIVLGVESERARKVMDKLYKNFVRSGNPIVFMDIKSAELTKYAANAFLATKITYMNEIANYCEKVGANVDDVRIGMGLDARIGKRFLFPGIGYGGSCFPKDVKALHKSGKDANLEFAILDSVIQVNENQKTVLFPKIKSHFNGDLKDKKIAVWGLAFKPDTDDIREAPALYMIDKLLASGAAITAFDPEAMDNVKAKLGDTISFASSMMEAVEGADALLICTEWHAFRNPNFDKLKTALKNNVIFDGRNIYSPSEMNILGFDYYSIGR
ncbi:MAG: UDP-glucose/GDP-mannose dehydrogenase family protein [Flavobacteriaceae bacterium]|nr:UDP-glucose/GDP-mannose dehydrogenase family protein [Flavobacteriaceae bacterium]